MTEIVPFVYGKTTVRTVSEDGESWFIATDVCAGIELSDTSSALRRVEDEDKRRFRRSDTPRVFRGIARQVQEIVCVNESGLYALIFQSRTEEARRFKRWVTSEVLPEVRRNGGYISKDATEDQLVLLADRAASQARVLRLLDGIVDPAWLEAKARHVAARALGEEPEIEHASRPLTVGEYLEDQGVTGKAQRSMSPVFGKALKRRYQTRYNASPPTVDRFVEGALRKVASYTEAHRSLFDAVWSDFIERKAS